jgi:hypothetical protein
VRHSSFGAPTAESNDAHRRVRRDCARELSKASVPEAGAAHAELLQPRQLRKHLGNAFPASLSDWIVPEREPGEADAV